MLLVHWCRVIGSISKKKVNTLRIVTNIVEKYDHVLEFKIDYLKTNVHERNADDYRITK